MERKKTRVAIVHNGKNSAGYALAEKTLTEQTITELFEPVMFEVVGDNDIEQVITTYKEGRIDTIVDVTNTSNDNQSQEALDSQWEKALEENGKGLSMLLTENMRMALAKSNTDITTELIVQMAETFYTSLRRDFRISNPRIAILYQTTKTDQQDDMVATPAIKQLTEQSIQVYGPYNAGDFFENGRHLDFDGVIATDSRQGIMHFNDVAIDDAVRFTTNLPLVRTQPIVQYKDNDADTEDTAMNVLRQAIYKAIDIARHRVEYDKPLANPLRKLYKERKDESEKTRFNIPKKKDQAEN